MDGRGGINYTRIIMIYISKVSKQLLASALCAAGLLTFSATAQAPNDVRIALIIGNSAYPGNMALANPSNDAKDMAKALRDMGFGVIEVIDSDRTKMLDAIERAGKSLSGKQGIGMLFYAGHGLQLDWRNYMVPVDAKLNSAADVPKQAVDIEAVMNTFKSAGNRMNIVVLDACRDNPFADGKTASGKGLAPLDAPTGTFLAYATAPGNVAADGAVGSKNGLYTGYLLQELQKPNASIENVFKRVRFQVRKASDGAQIPWETTSLEDDFVFNSGIKKVVKLTENEKEKQFDIEKADWDKIKDSKSADSFFAFVQKYPNGQLTQSAMAAIDRFNKAKTVAVADKSGQIIRNGYADVFRVGDRGEFIRYDGYTKKELFKRASEIVSIKDGIVTFAGNVLFTTAGEFIRNGDGTTFDPPLPALPAEGVAVGRKWEGRVSLIPGSGPRKGEKGWTEINGKILAYETVTVPAGTFKAYKIEQNSVNIWGTRSKMTIWTDFEAGTRVKAEFEERRGGNNADRWYEELVTYKRGPRI
jgi:Caspase domain